MIIIPFIIIFFVFILITFSFFFIFLGDFFCNSMFLFFFYNNYYSYFNFFLHYSYFFKFECFFFDFHEFFFFNFFQNYLLFFYPSNSTELSLIYSNSLFLNLSSIFVYFYSDVQSSSSLSSSDRFIHFYPLQNYIFLTYNDPVLIFYKLVNSSSNFFRLYSTYHIIPEQYLYFLKKIQCFCFDEILIQPFDVVMLPVFFYVSSDVHNFIFSYDHCLHLHYNLFVS